MDDRNREDAVDALLQRRLDLCRLGPPCLDAQQARDGLQVVLDAMVDLLDDGRLDTDFLVLSARLCDIRNDDDAHAEIAALADDDLAPYEDEPARRDLLLPRPIRLHRLARDMLRHLAVKEMAAAQAADAEHAVDAHGRGIRKDDAAVRIRYDDAIARRDWAELLRIEDVARMVEHRDRRIEEMRVALDGELVEVYLEVQHADDLVAIVDAEREHVDHRAVIPLALATRRLACLEGLLDERLLDGAHAAANCAVLARQVDRMRALLCHDQEGLRVLRPHVDLELPVREVRQKREDDCHAREQADLQHREPRLLPAQACNIIHLIRTSLLQIHVLSIAENAYFVMLKIKNTHNRKKEPPPEGSSPFIY